MVVALITARAGSKGIPNKNMIDLGGKPLLQYSFEVAVACQTFEKIYLSTDMQTAVDLAKMYPKVEVPFIRPPELSNDQTTQFEVAEHLLEYLYNVEKIKPEYLVLLQPTCPLRDAREIDSAVQLMKDKKLESLIGVTEVMHHPSDYIYHDFTSKDTFKWVMRSSEWRQRQDFPKVYFNSGALYICSCGFLFHEKQFFNEQSYLYEMSQETIFDVDSDFDLALLRSFISTR